MKNIICYIATSLDWYIATTDGGVQRLDSINEEFASSNTSNWYEEFYSTIDTIIMWAATYRQILSFGVWRPYPGKQTYVITTHDLQTDIEDVQFINSDIIQKIQDIKNTWDWNIRLVWWAGVVDLLLSANLVDKFSISLMPEVLWAGIPLFRNKLEKKLKLQKTQAIWAWVIQLDYDVV